MRGERVTAWAPGSRSFGPVGPIIGAAAVEAVRSAVRLGEVQERFDLAVDQARAGGVTVPCLTDPRGLWLSNRAADRMRAARKCVDCLLLGVCDDLAQASEATWGVWAGRDYTPRDSRAGAVVAPERDPDAARLRVLGKLPRTPERRAERNRLIITLNERDPAFWSHRRLAETAGLAGRPGAVWNLVHSGGASTRAPSASKPRSETDRERHRRGTEESRARREVELAAEAAALNDPRVNRLRELGRWRCGPGREWGSERDQLLAELAVSDPSWTVTRLSAVTGMSRAAVRSAVLSVVGVRPERKRDRIRRESA